MLMLVFLLMFFTRAFEQVPCCFGLSRKASTDVATVASHYLTPVTLSARTPPALNNVFTVTTPSAVTGAARSSACRALTSALHTGSGNGGQKGWNSMSLPTLRVDYFYVASVTWKGPEGRVVFFCRSRAGGMV